MSTDETEVENVEKSAKTLIGELRMLITPWSVNRNEKRNIMQSC